MMEIPVCQTFRIRQRKTLSLLPLFVLTVICIVGTLWPMAGAVYAGGGQTEKASQGPSDLQRLEGRWVRPDGGYVLALSKVKKDGSLTAAYYNPRPIKVFSAKWSRKEGKISLFVELRDINYPGSTYTLLYDPKSDRLKGTYFQAVERRTFDIEFLRAK